MRYTQNAGYGQAFLTALIGNAPTTGKTFVIAATTDGNYGMLQDLLRNDADGVPRLHSTYAAALTHTVAGRGDAIIVSPSMTTAPTLAQLATINTNGINVRYGFGEVGTNYIANRATAALPASTLGNLFAVTGLVKVKQIIGEVTTVIQTQICNLKLHTNPTVSTDIDICANLDVTAAAVGSKLVITGTLANALINLPSGGGIAQAGAVVVPAGFLSATTSATNTGSVKWLVQYEPLEPGAFMIAV